MKTESRIVRTKATPVSVPAKPDSLNSPGIDDDNAAFVARFATGKSWDDFANQTKWIVELKTACGARGIGETYRSVQRSDVETALQNILGADVLALNWRRLPVQNARVYDAIETAIMDVAGRILDVPIYQLLGGACRDKIECSGWTGRRTPADAARKAREAMQRGHRVFKFKCSDTDAVRDWCEAIQKECGDGIKILLDPNQRWNDVETTLRLMSGVPPAQMFGLEDPIAREDYAGFRVLREELKIPIFMHIALPYAHQGQRAEDALTAICERSCDGFNFNGPMWAFVELARVAELAGLPCWHGSEVDLGILEASAVHACAAAASCTIPSDLFGELVREDDLIETGLLFENGHVQVPQGAGLGVELDRDALAHFATAAPVILEIPHR
jgi:muconate cycloisomerase